MTYTEIRNIRGKKYYYRVMSVRNKDKISKKRVYLGYSLSNLKLSEEEKLADEQLLPKKAGKANKEIEKIKRKITNLLKGASVNRAGIFGSYSRGEQKKNSDIDIVIDIKNKNMSLLDFIGLKLELEKILKKKVDLVEYSALKPLIKENILNEEIKII
jgi:predicted nucleotidyltransferase